MSIKTWKERQTAYGIEDWGVHGQSKAMQAEIDDLRAEVLRLNGIGEGAVAYIGRIDFETLQSRGRVTLTAYSTPVGDKSNEVALYTSPPIQAHGGGAVAWTYGPNDFKSWCAQWFGPDADDSYLSKAIHDLPKMAQNFADAKEAMSRDARQALIRAYGHLWHVNNEPAAPIAIYDPERAAYNARKILRELLTHEERGEGINQVGAEIGRYERLEDDTSPPLQADACKVPQWRPIETAPKDGTPHVRGLHVHNNKGDFIYWEASAGRVNEETGAFEDFGGEHFGWDADDYTHWTPLPAAPSTPPMETNNEYHN